ncbi:MAG: hypothetical protein ACYDBB_25380 [Armatimonadota bacterium]
MITRILRIALPTLTLAAAFTLGMLYAQRAPMTPAQAAGESPVVQVIPISTEQSKNGDTTVTYTKKVLAIRADGTVRVYTGTGAYVNATSDYSYF